MYAWSLLFSVTRLTIFAFATLKSSLLLLLKAIHNGPSKLQLSPFHVSCFWGLQHPLCCRRRNLFGLRVAIARSSGSNCALAATGCSRRDLLVVCTCNNVLRISILVLFHACNAQVLTFVSG